MDHPYDFRWTKDQYEAWRADVIVAGRPRTTGVGPRDLTAKKGASSGYRGSSGALSRAAGAAESSSGGGRMNFNAASSSAVDSVTPKKLSLRLNADERGAWTVAFSCDTNPCGLCPPERDSRPTASRATARPHSRHCPAGAARPPATTGPPPARFRRVASLRAGTCILVAGVVWVGVGSLLDAARGGRRLVGADAERRARG